jgi:hypothetical protein
MQSQSNEMPTLSEKIKSTYLPIYRVNSKLDMDKFNATPITYINNDFKINFTSAYIDLHNKTVMVNPRYIKYIEYYTGIMASSATCYVDIHFKYSSCSVTYLICGHYAGLATIQKAKELGIEVEGEDSLCTNTPILPFLDAILDE